MEIEKIREGVSSEIEHWKDLQERRQVDVKITPKAIEFIIELIANIQDDPSYFWRENYNIEAEQQFAISLIPNALNDVYTFYNFRHRRSKQIRISSWELWQALSEILVTFCFIPEDDDK